MVLQLFKPHFSIHRRWSFLSQEQVDSLAQYIELPPKYIPVTMLGGIVEFG
jgi:hypothetical protein